MGGVTGLVGVWIVDAVDVGERNPEWGKWTGEGAKGKDVGIVDYDTVSRGIFRGVYSDVLECVCRGGGGGMRM